MHADIRSSMEDLKQLVLQTISNRNENKNILKKTTNVSPTIAISSPKPKQMKEENLHGKNEENVMEKMARLALLQQQTLELQKRLSSSSLNNSFADLKATNMQNNNQQINQIQDVNPGFALRDVVKNFPQSCTFK